MAYTGFKKVEAAAAKGGARNPAAMAAAVGRKKYGKAKLPPGMRSKMLRGGK